jgi:hypothetical protein
MMRLKQEFVLGFYGGGEKVLKVVRIILSVIVIALAGYGLINKNFEFMSLTMLFLGMSILVTGLLELQAKRKSSAVIFILASAFILFVAIYTF